MTGTRRRGSPPCTEAAEGGDRHQEARSRKERRGEATKAAGRTAHERLNSRRGERINVRVLSDRGRNSVGRERSSHGLERVPPVMSLVCPACAPLCRVVSLSVCGCLRLISYGARRSGDRTWDDRPAGPALALGLQ